MQLVHPRLRISTRSHRLSLFHLLSGIHGVTAYVLDGAFHVVVLGSVRAGEKYGVVEAENGLLAGEAEV